MNNNPGPAWIRYKNGKGPLHELTESIAKAIHESNHDKSWENARENDSWLAVGSWMTAEAVVAILPLSVALSEKRKP